jgi:hypothetical protein
VALLRSCVSQRLASPQGRSLRGVTDGAPFNASDTWIHQRRRQQQQQQQPTDNNYALDGYVQVDDPVERKEADDADDLPSEGEATDYVPLTKESPTPKDDIATEKPTETEEKDQIDTVHDDLVIRDGDDVLEKELDEVETEAKAFGGFGFLAAMVAVVFTAHQMLENPHGIYASICRLIITIVSCVIRAVLMPFRSILGHRGYRTGHVPISTTDPYVSHQMELT